MAISWLRVCYVPVLILCAVFVRGYESYSTAGSQGVEGIVSFLGLVKFSGGFTAQMVLWKETSRGKKSRWNCFNRAVICRTGQEENTRQMVMTPHTEKDNI